MPERRCGALLRRGEGAPVIGFYLGYAERTAEGGAPHHFTSILVGPRRPPSIGKYRARSTCAGHDDHRPNVPCQHLEKKYFEVGDPGLQRLADVQ